MSNKKLRNRDQGDERPSLLDKATVRILGGALLVLLFVGVGIGIVTLLGGDDLSKEDPEFPPIPALGEEPTAERSEVADLLESKSFDDMTEDEIKRIADEVVAVMANADVRFSSDATPAIDVWKRDGRTRAARAFRYREGAPGGGLVLETTTAFYCDAPEGMVDVYHVVSTGFDAEDKYERVSAESPPFELVVRGLEWSEPADLGYREIDGRRAHGVGLRYKAQDNAEGVPAEHWFDVENARLLAYTETAGTTSFDFTVDWRKPPAIEVPSVLSTPPCASLVTGD